MCRYIQTRYQLLLCFREMLQVLSSFRLEHGTVLGSLYLLLIQGSKKTLNNLSSVSHSAIRIPSFWTCTTCKYYMAFFIKHFFIVKYWLHQTPKFWGGLSYGKHLIGISWCPEGPGNRANQDQLLFLFLFKYWNQIK